MNDEQLGDALKDAYKKLFWVKFRATTEKVESAAERKELRRSIARIKTLQREWAYRLAYHSSAHRSRALPGYLRWYNRHRPTARWEPDHRSAASHTSVVTTASYGSRNRPRRDVGEGEC